MPECNRKCGGEFEPGQAIPRDSRLWNNPLKHQGASNQAKNLLEGDKGKHRTRCPSFYEKALKGAPPPTRESKQGGQGAPSDPGWKQKKRSTAFLGPLGYQFPPKG